MKVVVDTNIAFSGILNANSRIGELLIKSKDYFIFFSVDYLKKELENHKDKIIRIANYSEDEFFEARELAISKIKFIRDTLIPMDTLLKTEKILHNIDKDDTIFLALSIHLNVKLWTGDLALIKGLEKKGFHNTITTKDMFKVYLKKEIQKR